MCSWLKCYSLLECSTTVLFLDDYSALKTRSTLLKRFSSYWTQTTTSQNNHRLPLAVLAILVLCLTNISYSLTKCHLYPNPACCKPMPKSWHFCRWCQNRSNVTTAPDDVHRCSKRHRRLFHTRWEDIECRTSLDNWSVLPAADADRNRDDLSNFQLIRREFLYIDRRPGTTTWTHFHTRIAVLETIIRRTGSQCRIGVIWPGVLFLTANEPRCSVLSAAVCLNISC